jgi:hypothetical protein
MHPMKFMASHSSWHDVTPTSDVLGGVPPPPPHVRSMASHAVLVMQSIWYGYADFSHSALHAAV